MLVYMVNFIDRQILSILANDIKADLGLDDAQLGFLYGTAFAVFYALFGIPLGRLADGTSRVRLLAAGLALWSAMTAASGIAKNFAQLSLARVGVGIGEASANPCAYSLLADWFPPAMRARALAIYSSGLFLGSGASLFVGGAIADAWNASYSVSPPLGLAGWQIAFLAVGIPGLALALWVRSLKEPERRSAAASGTIGWSQFLAELFAILPPFTLLAAGRLGRNTFITNVAFATLFAVIGAILGRVLDNMLQFGLIALGFYAVASWAIVLRKRDPDTFALTFGNLAFVAVVLAYSFESYVGYSLVYWGAPYAERSFAIDKTTLGILIGAPNAVGGFLGVVTGGWIADRLAERFAAGRAMTMTIAILAPVPLVLLGYSTTSQSTFLLCNFLIQLTTASALGAAAAASQSLVAPRMRGTAAAIFLLGPTLIGLGFGPFMVGYVSTQTGDLATGVIWSIAGAVPALAALMVAVRVMPTAITRLKAA